jgi:protein-S-isoprenylcysteine O-methyltransferase Ste14
VQDTISEGFSMILLEVDPNWVKPGWMLVLVILLLAAAMVFLYLSMRKQFRKIRTLEDDEPDSAEESASERPPSTPS